MKLMKYFINFFIVQTAVIKYGKTKFLIQDWYKKKNIKFVAENVLKQLNWYKHDGFLLIKKSLFSYACKLDDVNYTLFQTVLS